LILDLTVFSSPHEPSLLKIEPSILQNTLKTKGTYEDLTGGFLDTFRNMVVSLGRTVASLERILSFKGSKSDFFRSRDVSKK
jgi:hypothetical protein